MHIKAAVNNKEAYLQEDAVINFGDPSIIALAEQLSEQAESGSGYIKAAYEFVRDSIAHSADIGAEEVTCSASEVLQTGHGICFAKSHLLAALLRWNSIPAGFCYQKLILDDEAAPFLVYHGLNGVYVEEYGKWIRLDARGNTNGIDAQYSVESEEPAFPIRPDKGEEDGLIVYPAPDAKILEVLRRNRTRTQLQDDLPTELGYDKTD